MGLSRIRTIAPRVKVSGIRRVGLIGSSLALAGILGSNGVAAEEREWDLYGRAALGIGLLDDGEDSELNIYDHGSRVGFSGTRVMDMGPDINWQVESGIDVDDGSGELASRDTFLGISDEWGALQAGYFGTPTRAIGRKVDLIY